MTFVDASALVKRYVREPHSVRVRRVLAAGPIAISRLSEVEVPSALRRLTREGRLSPRGHDRALRAFVADLASWHLIEVSSDITALARQLLLRHVLRAGDAIQLASALWLQEVTNERLAGLLAFDERLVAAVRAEEIRLIGPTKARQTRS